MTRDPQRACAYGSSDIPAFAPPSPVSTPPRQRLDICRYPNARSTNAVAESVISLFRAELVWRRWLWRSLEEDVEFAMLELIAWQNHSASWSQLSLCLPPSTSPITLGRSRITPHWRESPELVSRRPEAVHYLIKPSVWR